jgi:hypothetical protein
VTIVLFRKFLAWNKKVCAYTNQFSLTEIVEAKASRANSFVGPVIVNSVRKGSQKQLVLHNESLGKYEMFHLRQLDEVLQISMPVMFDKDKSEFQCSNQYRIRSQRKCRNLLRFDPMYKN